MARHAHMMLAADLQYRLVQHRVTESVLCNLSTTLHSFHELELAAELAAQTHLKWQLMLALTR